MEISGIPEGIPRVRIVELIEALGIDVKKLVGLRMDRDVIHAEVYALHNGRHYFDGDKQAATHTIAIPIQDVPSTLETGQAVFNAIRDYEDRGPTSRESDPRN